LGFGVAKVEFIFTQTPESEKAIQYLFPSGSNLIKIMNISLLRLRINAVLM
jgi:hypothetical protein